MNPKSSTKASQEEVQKLSAFIAEVKSKKKATKFKQLDRYRDVLLKERDKASVREITEAVTELGIDVSEETVRVWFQRNAVAPITKMVPKPIKRVSASDGSKDTVAVAAPARGPHVARDNI